MNWKLVTDFLKNTLDVIEDIFAIIIALGVLLFGWFVDKTLFQNDPLLWSGVVAILTIMAIGNLRDRRRRLRKIHETVEETLQEIRGNKIIEVSGADYFFNRKEDEIRDRLLIAERIDIVGITLSTTAAKIRETLIDRLKESTKVRVIILDNNSDDALEQLVKRSWSKKAKKVKYVAMIDNTSDLLEEIGNIPGLSGSFEIGFLPFLPSVGMTLVDIEQELGVGVVSLYHQLKKTNQTFHIGKQTDPKTFTFYTEQFDLMWNECKTNKVKKIV